MKKKHHILLVEDEPLMRMSIAESLRHEGYQVTDVNTGSEGLNLAQSKNYDAVITDLKLPGADGIEILKASMRSSPVTQVIIITAYASIQTAVEAMKEGARDYLTKPFSTEELLLILKRSIEYKEMEEENIYLRQQEAKLAVVAKILGNISHDVKNLLMPVLTGVKLLDTELKELFEKIPDNKSYNLSQNRTMCNDILEMLRDSTKRFQERMKEIADVVKGVIAPPQFEPCQVAEVVDGAIKTLGLIVAEKKISLATEGLNNLPPIQGDKRRLFNAFYNLINNAIEEVPPGGSIFVRTNGVSTAGTIEISVTDNGRGMPPEVRDSLFSAGAISRKPGGTGLGTQIIKDAVDLHHGQIKVESKEGVGTTFLLSLPVQQPEENHS